jgi:hypothetical protein
MSNTAFSVQESTYPGFYLLENINPDHALKENFNQLSSVGENQPTFHE